MLVNLKFIGQPLSNSSPWTSLVWTQSLLNPYIKIQCGLKKYRQKLAKKLGSAGREEGGDSGQGLFLQKSFIAPFIRELEFACTEPVNSIEIGWDSSFGFNHYMQQKKKSAPLIYVN